MVREGICSALNLFLISNISKTEFRLFFFFYPENVLASSVSSLDETSFVENVSTNFSCDVRLNLAVQQQKKIFLYDRETMMKLA